MRRISKTLALVLAAVMMLTCFVPAFADDIVTYEQNNIIYDINKTYSTAAVAGTKPELAGEVTIPSEIVYNGSTYTVNRIEENAFRGRTEVTLIRVEEGVAQIDGNAFTDCTGLRTMYLPQTVTVCAVTAFNGCSDLTVHAYKRLSNLAVVDASTGVNFVFIDAPTDVKGFFQGLWEMIVNFFNRVVVFFRTTFGGVE